MPASVGAKGRDQRPGINAMLKDANWRKFDVVMAWAIDRLGRSLIDLLGTIQHLGAGPAKGPQTRKLGNLLGLRSLRAHRSNSAAHHHVLAGVRRAYWSGGVRCGATLSVTHGSRHPRG
jgi:Resolvase, N terminal domain